jgi:hypothetical protein
MAHIYYSHLIVVFYLISLQFYSYFVYNHNIFIDKTRKNIKESKTFLEGRHRKDPLATGCRSLLQPTESVNNCCINECSVYRPKHSLVSVYCLQDILSPNFVCNTRLSYQSCISNDFPWYVTRISREYVQSFCWQFLGRPKYMLVQYSLIMGNRRIGCGDAIWLKLAESRVQRRGLVLVVSHRWILLTYDVLVITELKTVLWDSPK